MQYPLRAAPGLVLGAVVSLLTACGQQQPPASGAKPAADVAPDQAAAEPSTELVVYSARKEHLIKPLFDAYTDKTGVEVRYITDKAGPLLERLQAEGSNTQADILMTVDVGNLWHAAEAGVLQPLQSDALNEAVPAHLRDEQGRWYGLSLRARTIVYATDRVEQGELDTYEALAHDQWSGRLCLRTSKKVYNQSLVASLIYHLGEERAEEVVKGWVENLAVPPFSNDTKVMEAIAAGQCDVGIVNSYYYGRLLQDDPDLELALFWPNQQGEGPAGRGVHVNVSGAGVTEHAPHPMAAQALLEWLASAQAQQSFAAVNQEYPVSPAVSASPDVAAWGEFKADDMPLEQAGRLQPDAVRLMDRAGYR